MRHDAQGARMAFADSAVELGSRRRQGWANGLHDGSWNLIDPDQIGNIAAKIMNAAPSDPDLSQSFMLDNELIALEGCSAEKDATIGKSDFVPYPLFGWGGPREDKSEGGGTRHGNHTEGRADRDILRAHPD